MVFLVVAFLLFSSSLNAMELKSVKREEVLDRLKEALNDNHKEQINECLTIIENNFAGFKYNEKIKKLIYKRYDPDHVNDKTESLKKSMISLKADLKASLPSNIYVSFEPKLEEVSCRAMKSYERNRLVHDICNFFEVSLIVTAPLWVWIGHCLESYFKSHNNIPQ